MKFTYSNKELEKWMVENSQLLMERGGFKALIAEMKVAEDAGSKFVNADGYDEIHPKKGKIETKYTSVILTGKCLRISSAGENKRNKFDFIRIIDGVNQKIFLLPHDVYYNETKRYGGELRWSGSYNKTDRVQVSNTKLLLKYEITE